MKQFSPKLGKLLVLWYVHTGAGKSFTEPGTEISSLSGRQDSKACHCLQLLAVMPSRHLLPKKMHSLTTMSFSIPSPSGIFLNNSVSLHAVIAYHFFICYIVFSVIQIRMKALWGQGLGPIPRWIPRAGAGPHRHWWIFAEWLTNECPKP